MKLKSRGENPVKVSLLSGHTISIPPEGREVPEMFLDGAFRAGCIPAEVNPDKIKANTNEPTGKDREQIIADGIKAMLDAECQLTGAGFPNLKDLSKQVGFTVAREEMIAVWNALQEEAGDSDEQSSGNEDQPTGGELGAEGGGE